MAGLRARSKNRSLRVMSTDAARKLNARLKSIPKLKGQSEKISKEYGQSLDAAVASRGADSSDRPDKYIVGQTRYPELAEIIVHTLESLPFSEYRPVSVDMRSLR